MTKDELFDLIQDNWLSWKKKQQLKAAVEEYSSALLRQTDVMQSLPPLPEIEQALNLAQAELRFCYRTLGYKKSNVISKVDEVLEAVQAAMPS